MSTPVYNQTPTVGSRPIGYKDAQGTIIPDSYGYLAFRGEYDGSNNLIYKGFARPGSVTSAAVWQIAKLTYDGSGNITSILWPENTLGKASNDFMFEWDLRATYTYI